MFDRSIIRKTGQSWKLMASFLATVVGATSMFLALGNLTDQPSITLLASLFGGMLLGFGGFLYANLAIRCPACSTRWVWVAVSKRRFGEWLTWLISQQKCPHCSFNPKTDAR